MLKNFSSRVEACFVAGAIGDAIGFAYENKPRAESFEIPESFTYTDDTQLTIATTESIFLSKGLVSPEKIAQRLVEWHKSQKIQYLGSSTLKALTELAAGGHWALVGRKGEHAAGNGAAIRIAPLIFYLDLDTEADRVKFRDICRITHHSDEAYAGGLALALVLQKLLFEPGQLNLVTLFDSLPDTLVRDRLLALFQQDPKPNLVSVAKDFGASGYVVESVPLAILAGTTYDSLIPMFEDLVKCGGDTDSNCFMAGQIFGSIYGLEAIPKEYSEIFRKSIYRTSLEAFIKQLPVPA